MTLAIWPAIDVRSGRVVRLLKGETGTETFYDETPADAARRFSREAADGIHVVDLDAAFGSGSNEDAIRAILGAASVPVEVGGGIRSLADAERMAALGASRLVVGSLAFSAGTAFGEVLAEFGERVVVALDCRGRRPTVTGWTADAGAGDVVDAARALGMRGVRVLLVTDVERDGMLAGPNLPLLADVRGVFGGEVLASGGVRGGEDLPALAAALAGGPAGVVVGKAIHSGLTSVASLVASSRLSA